MKLCACGCGQPTPVAKRTNRSRGYRAGEQVHYIVGHGFRGCHRRSGPEYIVTESGCWEWQHARSPDGYGLAWREGQGVRAHVWFYEQHVGPIPDGLVSDHLCRNRACVNPDHIEPVTNAENSRRGLGTKLSWEQVRVIRESSERGSDLARRFGVSQQTVCDIRKGRKWVAA